jgi:hypothetical protein
MAQYYFDFYYLPPQEKKSMLMYVKYLSQIGFSGAMTIAVWQGIYFYYQGNLQIPQKLFNSNPT